MNILSSRTVAEDVIQKLKLIKTLFSDDWDEGNKRWKVKKPPTLQDTLLELQKNIARITDDRKGTIGIAVEFRDPQIAADIANGARLWAIALRIEQRFRLPGYTVTRVCAIERESRSAERRLVVMFPGIGRLDTGPFDSTFFGWPSSGRTSASAGHRSFRWGIPVPRRGPRH